MDYVPYTYLIGWSKLNLWYYGSRYINSKRGIAHPTDLWKTYFTSSKYVKRFRQQHGEPDVIEIRKTFVTAIEARMWEAKVLRRIDAAINIKFINKTNSDGKFSNTGNIHTPKSKNKISEANKGKRKGISPHNKGKKTSEEIKNKISSTLKKRPPRSKGKRASEETKQKMAASRKKYFTANPPLSVIFYNVVTKEEVLVTNLTEFSKERGLNSKGLSDVFCGKYATHRNWSLNPTPKKHPSIKQYKFIYNGEVVNVTNLRKFCRENGLSKDGMYNVNSGKLKSHRGYTRYHQDT